MNLQSKFFILLICLFLTNTAMGKTSQEIIEGCWTEGAHPAMAACVEKYAKAANLSLVKIELAVRNTIVTKATMYPYAAEAKDALESSIASFHVYRRTECNFREIMARTGNASDTIKLACEAELDEKKTSELQADIWWLE